MKMFCSKCGVSEEALGPLSWFTIWNNKLVCLECWKALKFSEENGGTKK